MGDYSWEIITRIDQPVEGCDITPHAYLKVKSSSLDNIAKSRLLDSNPHMFQFKWTRCPIKQSCSNKNCPRQTTNDPVNWSKYIRGSLGLQCAVCERAGYPRHHALFCCSGCFKEAWRKHAELKHKNVATISESLYKGDNESEMNLADMNLIENTENWPTIGKEKTYIPTLADVGHVLRVEVIAIGHNGEILAGPVSIFSDAVIAAPHSCPRKSLTPISTGNNSNIQHRFRVVSYNVLAEIYATRYIYPYADAWSLNWSYRQKLLVAELKEFQGDIICLQEVQADHFEMTLLGVMAELGYDGLFKAKTRESMGQYGKIDGCAMFWKRSKFLMAENYSIEFNECARRTAMHLGLDDSELHRYINKVCKDNIAQVVVFEALPRVNRPRSNGPVNPTHICVVNTHLYSNPTKPEIKLWQIYSLLQEIEHFVIQQDLALLICGDFNSEPGSSVYEYLSQGYVDPNHPDITEEGSAILPAIENVVHNLDLASVLATSFGQEPEFTNYTKNFKGTLDYIWYTPGLLKVMAVSNLPEEHEITEVGEALPNVCYPSDHLLLCCDLALCAQSASNMPPPMPPNSVGGMRQPQQQVPPQRNQPQMKMPLPPQPNNMGISPAKAPKGPQIRR